jgi:hypothetical protein
MTTELTSANAGARPDALLAPADPHVPGDTVILAEGLSETEGQRERRLRKYYDAAVAANPGKTDRELMDILLPSSHLAWLCRRDLTLTEWWVAIRGSRTPSVQTSSALPGDEAAA